MPVIVYAEFCFVEVFKHCPINPDWNNSAMHYQIWCHMQIILLEKGISMGHSILSYIIYSFLYTEVDLPISCEATGLPDTFLCQWVRFKKSIECNVIDISQSNKEESISVACLRILCRYTKLWGLCGWNTFF